MLSKHNFKKSIVFSLLLFLLMPLFVSAQYGNPADGMLGGMEKGILNTVSNILNYQIPVSGGVWWSYDYKEASSGSKTPEVLAKAITVESGTPRVAIWLLASVFILIFTIVWLASSFVPLFKDEEHKSPRRWFCIALTLITMFTTPVALMIINMIGTFTSLAMIAILVLGIYTIWTLFRGGWASNATMNSNSTKELAAARQVTAEAQRSMAQTDEYKLKTKKAASSGLKNQAGSIRSLRRDLERVLSDLNRYKTGRTHSNLGRSYEKRIIRDLSQISTDLGKVISFQTANDRILSGMNKSNYSQKNTFNINGSTMRGGNSVVDIQKTTDTETHDLGAIIAGLMNEIRIHGIQNTPPNENCTKLIELTSNAVNIAKRMERDIVLEEQMIERI